MHLSFFFNDTATTEIYTLSLHDALPISQCLACIRGLRKHLRESHQRARTFGHVARLISAVEDQLFDVRYVVDRKSTRLNSSHSQISYAVFCLKKKNEKDRPAHAPPAHAA